MFHFLLVAVLIFFYQSSYGTTLGTGHNFSYNYTGQSSYGAALDPDDCTCIFSQTANDVVLNPDCSWKCLIKESNPLNCFLQSIRSCPLRLFRFINGTSSQFSQLLMFNHPTQKNDFHIRFRVTKQVLQDFAITADYAQVSVAFFPKRKQSSELFLKEYNLVYTFDWVGEEPTPLEEEYWPPIEVPENIRVYYENAPFGKAEVSPYIYVYFNPPSNGTKPSCYEATCYGTDDITACDRRINGTENSNAAFPYQFPIKSSCGSQSNNEDPLMINIPWEQIGNVACVKCQIRGHCQYNRSNMLTGPWSEPFFVSTSTSMHPPKLLISHLNYWGYKNQSLRYIIDIDGIFSLAAKNKTKWKEAMFVDYDSFGNIYSDERMFCLDWIGQYKYSVSKCGSASCIYRENYQPINLQSSYFNAHSPSGQLVYKTGQRIGRLLCSPQQDSIFFTEATGKRWQLNFIKRTSMVDGPVKDLKPLCNTSFDSSTFAFDWKNTTKEMTSIFIATTAGIQQMMIDKSGKEECIILEVLPRSRFPNETGEIAFLESDWVYLYFSNGSSNINLYSWREDTIEVIIVSFWDTMLANTQDMDEISGFWPLINITDMKIFTPPARPFAPSSCTFPSAVNITKPQMQSNSTAFVEIQFLWNDSVDCQQFPIPPIVIYFTCLNDTGDEINCDIIDITGDNEINCDIEQFQVANQLTVTRSNRLNLSLSNLPWNQYVVFKVAASPIYSKAYKTTPKSANVTFCTKFLDKNSSIIYWPFIIVIIFTVVGAVGTVWFLKRRKREEYVGDVNLIQSKDLEWDKYIAKGHFGEVWRGTLVNRSKDSATKTRISVAIKQPRNEESRKGLLQEVILIAHLQHENIIRVLGICMHTRTPSEQSVQRQISKLPVLVLEYMNGESCSTYFVNNYKNLSLQSVFLVAQNILKACVYLEFNKYVHRDIAARNCLLEINLQTSQIVKAKLSDFGLARDVSDNGLYKPAKNEVFSRRSTSPEGWNGCYSSKSDVWSYGLFMWELFTMLENGTLAFPYENIRQEHLKEAICTPGHVQVKPNNCPTTVFDMMKTCWNIDPIKRPSFADLEKGFVIQFE